MLSVFWIWSCLTLFKDGSTPIAKICWVDILPLQCLSILFSMSWVWSCLALCEEGPTPVAEIWVDSFFETVWSRSSELRYTFHRVWFPNLLILQPWIQFCIRGVSKSAFSWCNSKQLLCLGRTVKAVIAGDVPLFLNLKINRETLQTMTL